MRNIPEPNFDDVDKFEKISSSKNRKYRDVLIPITDFVAKRYKEYVDNKNNLEKMSSANISSARREALTKCYLSPTSVLNKLKEKIVYPDLDDFDACPYCDIGEPKTIDHYLPKEEFPEYAVFSKNLVPVCSVCNSNYKKTYWIKDGKRLFFNPYFDSIPDEEFLLVELDIDGGIKIDYQASDVPNEYEFSGLFKNHFEKLALNKRYKIKAAAEISRKRRTLKRLYNNKSWQGVSSMLSNELDKLEEEFSKNHWKTSLYKALSKSKDFCDKGFDKPLKIR